MDELHHRGELYVVLPAVVAGRGGQQGQQGPQALAPGLDNVVPDVLHQSHVRLQIRHDQGVHSLQVLNDR